VNAAGETPLLVRDLAMHFAVSGGIVPSRKIGDVRAAGGVGFAIGRGETLGLAGEGRAASVGSARALALDPVNLFEMPNPPSGCVFHPRCPKAVDACKAVRPELREVRSGHWVACSEVH
jgi:ABC-type dipeptide/oligopeptide/nickel transport system ATPase component